MGLNNFLKETNSALITNNGDTYILGKKIIFAYQMPSKGFSTQDIDSLNRANSMQLDNTPVPYLYYSQNGSDLTVVRIAVPTNINGEDYRRRGIGLEMLHVLVNHLKSTVIRISAPNWESCPWWEDEVTPAMQKLRITVIPISQEEKKRIKDEYDLGKSLGLIQ